MILVKVRSSLGARVLFDVFFVDVDVPELDYEMLEFRKAQERGQLIDLPLLRVFELVAHALTGLVVDHATGGRRSLNKRVQLHAAPRVGGAPGDRGPVSVDGPFAFQRHRALRMKTAKFFVVLAEGLQLFDEFDPAFDKQLGGFVDT